ncbi:DJ-1/PfpI family protein [Thermaerobacillus caldiproteolyticus]|uniref:Cyclohexyl-isocyanide hydratase n=1 Tax=Thermaerobacillus caldiproteolyticus TaxID=247480 RepID=A0A7W0C139_9BACL|nr:DJ-1/PfpI family protein [Anoxybacillus caldiproteolyticus]MBA2876594.1 cyclohexyl-isocyanide hydratase [Anoxybacillus caldiproteolyticus]QPA32143.1 DJ-1/PfpI family protein [Anoxybacillus caldiproteolyticus]
MKVSFIIFEGVTALDFVGVYDSVTRLKTMGFIPDLEWDVCSYSEEVKDGTGLRFTPTKVGQSLQNYDIIIVPGGFGTRKLVEDNDFIQWLKTSESCKLKASVCTGALLLGSAGFLEGKTATTHPNAFNDLKKYCTVLDQRIVDEGNIITARGVSSSIDLGLYLCEKLAGYEAKEKIRIQMDYRTS